LGGRQGFGQEISEQSSTTAGSMTMSGCVSHLGHTGEQGVLLVPGTVDLSGNFCPSGDSPFRVLGTGAHAGAGVVPHEVIGHGADPSSAVVRGTCVSRTGSYESVRPGSAACVDSLGGMDLMSEVIRTIRVGSASGRVIRQSASRGLRFPAMAGSGFHIVLGGACWLVSENEEPVGLEPGDVVLTSSGAGHGLTHVPRALEDLPPVVMGPMPPAPGPFGFEFLCCCYRLEHGRTPQYLSALPDLIVMSLNDDRHPEMRALVGLLTAAVSGTQVGAGATLPALLDLVLVHVLRQWHEQHGAAAGWLQTSDPAIAAALREIHEDPQRNWTVGRRARPPGCPARRSRGASAQWSDSHR
jgi:Cupin